MLNTLETVKNLFLSKMLFFSLATWVFLVSGRAGKGFRQNASVVASFDLLGIPLQ